MAEDRINRIPGRMMEVMLEEVYDLINDLLRDVVNPEQIAGFIQSMGLNAFALPGPGQGQPELDPYKILGLEKSASDEEVKKRYRDLLYRLHPDTAGVRGTEFVLGLVMEAYKRISAERGWL